MTYNMEFSFLFFITKVCGTEFSVTFCTFLVQFGHILVYQLQSNDCENFTF